MEDQRSLILAAVPIEPAELKTIFSDRPGSVRRSLEHPPSIRDAGWNLQTLDRSKLLRGELIRVESSRMAIDLYRDGSLILVGRVYRNFLTWSDEDDLRLHALALIELTLNFTRFYRLVLDDFRAIPKQIVLRIELSNMHLANQKTILRAGPVGRNLWQGGLEAPADNWSAELVVSSEAYDPDQTAFLLIREMYLWFGHSEEAIPYTKDTGGGIVIDADQIASLR